LLASVGSTNFDNRSFRVNDEARLNVIDHAFAAEQSAAFEADLTLAHLASHVSGSSAPFVSGSSNGWP
jgi:cardiolipin synthase